MQVTTQTEVRTVKAVIVEGASHFFYDGFTFQPGIGRGSMDYRWNEVSGAVKGTVKVVRLKSGRYSLRSTGKKGNGRLIHVSGDTSVLVDGVQSTVKEFFAKHSN